MSNDFVLKGKRLRVNCSNGMLADKTKCFVLEGGQRSSSTAEKGERTVLHWPGLSMCLFVSAEER